MFCVLSTLTILCWSTWWGSTEYHKHSPNCSAIQRKQIGINTLSQDREELNRWEVSYNYFLRDMIQVRHPIPQSVWEMYVEQTETHAWKCLLTSAEKCKKSGVVDKAALTFFNNLSSFLFHVNMETYETKLQEIKLKLGEVSTPIGFILGDSPHTMFDRMSWKSEKGPDWANLYIGYCVGFDWNQNWVGRKRESYQIIQNLVWQLYVWIFNRRSNRFLLVTMGVLLSKLLGILIWFVWNPDLVRKGCIVISNDEDDLSESVPCNITTLDLRAIDKVEEGASYQNVGRNNAALSICNEVG